MLPVLPADEPCELIPGPSRDHCNDGRTGGGGGDGGGGGVPDPLESVDPLHQLAKEFAGAADWMARQLGNTVANRDAVDFTNAGFLQQYAVVFAASTVLVLILWLLAITKRAVRGVPMTTAFSEAIGLLWLAVGAAAFTPLVLYTVVSAASAITDALVSATGSTPGGLFADMGKTLKDGEVGGGPIVLIVASVLTIALCGAVWLLLVLRAVSLYAGALLGIVVYSGLVDRDLWGHVRRWAALMVGLILIEPILIIVLGLASALQRDGGRGPLITGLAVTACALGAAVYLIFKFPAFGDAIKVGRAMARTAGSASRIVTGTAGAAVGVQRGIDAHAPRSGGVNGTSRSTPKPSNPASGGISTHGNRTPKKDDKGD